LWPAATRSGPLEALRQQAQSIAAPPQHLEQINVFAAEDEHLTSERITLEYGLLFRSEAFEAGAHGR
jgi:hypothetical protein